MTSVNSYHSKGCNILEDSRRPSGRRGHLWGHNVRWSPFTYTGYGLLLGTTQILMKQVGAIPSLGIKRLEHKLNHSPQSRLRWLEFYPYAFKVLSLSTVATLPCHLWFLNWCYDHIWPVAIRLSSKMFAGLDEFLSFVMRLLQKWYVRARASLDKHRICCFRGGCRTAEDNYSTQNKQADSTSTQHTDRISIQAIWS
jgi:hypothetical protein